VVIRVGRDLSKPPHLQQVGVYGIFDAQFQKGEIELLLYFPLTWGIAA